MFANLSKPLICFIISIMECPPSFVEIELKGGGEVFLEAREAINCKGAENVHMLIKLPFL